MLALPEAKSERGDNERTAILLALIQEFPLPAHAGPVSVFTEAQTVLGSTIHLAGVSSQVGEEVICGSAAGLRELPLDRAYFELLERVSVLVAIARPESSFPVRDANGKHIGDVSGTRVFASLTGAQWRAARSNGVAIGPTWARASSSAKWELVERDRVLRSWYGELSPVFIPNPDLEGLFPGQINHAYDVQAYDLGSDDKGHVTGVFAFPHGPEPLAYGFAARSSRDAAVTAAATECVQRLGFLWGEPIPMSDPEVVPCPDYHQEFYLVPANHGALRAWLRGEHSRYRGLLRNRSPERSIGCCEESVSSEILFVDLTPSELRQQLWVAKAIQPDHVPLVFGHGHPWVTDVPRILSVHPVA